MKWISVKEQLPKKKGSYLLLYKTVICTGWFSMGRFSLDDDRIKDVTVTHWMDLPELP